MSRRFQSIEQEVIFNKLKNGLGYENTTVEVQQNQVLLNASQQYFAEIDGHLNTLLQTRENFAYRYLHSNRKVIGPIIVFLKKVSEKTVEVVYRANYPSANGF
ncbi:hypothetical protein [Paenibacillus gorillae]|uniref:hypothetical protein n=1 Tax=Paenibacillus gorillae TaxID=1243662 RepID=UPI0005A8B4E8|nr:hypothetical protein [Paenibacillus gorillae]